MKRPIPERSQRRPGPRWRTPIAEAAAIFDPFRVANLLDAPPVVSLLLNHRVISRTPPGLGVLGSFNAEPTARASSERGMNQSPSPLARG